jgi:adenine-specific DNA-methyltransferase
VLARINELLRQLRLNNAALAEDIEREVDVLAARRAFGLNFERHTPEAVELPGRTVRTGDKVHVLPPRGQLPTEANRKLWRVVAISGTTINRVATLEQSPRVESAATLEVVVADLVVVAGFRDSIYPGLVSTGKIERGGEKPFHTIINGENYHALQTLLFTHRGKVDAIYIDPPYNTGARDWKYNNDYVENDDLYRHSKWLAFMERRLLVAKDLLNPDDSVLMVTIDEKEHLRLGLLLEQVFPESRVQVITALTNPKGVARGQEFYRVDEYIFVVYLGAASVSKGSDPMILTGKRNLLDASEDLSHSSRKSVRWGNLLRSGTDASREDRKNQFYPIYLHLADGSLHSVGEALLPVNTLRDSTVPPSQTIAIWPIRKDGSEGRWQVGAGRLRELFDLGYASIGKFRGSDRVSFSYVTENVQAEIANGSITVTGRDKHNTVALEYAEDSGAFENPKTMWNKQSHSASEYGSTLLRAFLPGRSFPFPKSLYAVEDALRFFVSRKPRAVIVDIFAGSGTTAHAVMRLNRQDGGHRISISVTNNEVSADEHVSLREQHLRPGDRDWEQWGICEYITKPRVRASITGKTPEGEPIKGDYKFTDEYPISDGLEENVEFLTLTYEAPLRIRANRDFNKVSVLLWLHAGSRGRRIESLPDGWSVVENYGVIANLDKTEEFFTALRNTPSAKTAFIITDDDSLFEAVALGLAGTVEPIRLYDAYLRNFEIDAMRGAR